MRLKLLAFLCSIAFVFTARSQIFFKHRIENNIYFSRLGLSENISYQLGIKDFKFGVGTGFNLLNLISSKYYAPHINLTALYLISNQEKIKFGLGFNYFYHWRINASNPLTHAHELFYGYKLVVGKTWQFINRVGVGALLRSDFPKSNTLLFNFTISIGLAYAF